MDRILEHFGIDRSAPFGGKLCGNAYRSLMTKAQSIFEELRKYFINLDSQVDVITTKMITYVTDTQIYYLQAFDGHLSGMMTKRYHLTEIIATKTQQYKNKCLELERYIQLSITPKSHVIEDHSFEQQNFFIELVI